MLSVWEYPCTLEHLRANKCNLTHTVTMLKIKDVIPTQFYGKHEGSQNPQERAKNDLVVLHLTANSDAWIGAGFMDDDFVMTVHATQTPLWSESVVKDPTGNVTDWLASLANLKQKSYGTQIATLHGFVVNVSQLFPECSALNMKVGGVDTDVSTRRIVGVGIDEKSAKEDALSRERGRLDFAIMKGRITKVLAAKEADDE